MYLRALEIQGFKSFPERTTIHFEKNVTMIVGPNGSGKSNISDAVLWVMGEQRTRALRGGRMEDVIFGGTEKRGKLGFAQVTLVLDNTARLFDINSDELIITRRYYRSGDSEYFINRESVRLRDIQQLLMDTGLGRDGYSIIGQGRIAEIVSAKSTDRREIFEQAAGIARFRYRKEEAERKLAATDDSLLRVGDKIEELEMQLGPLRKQAAVAEKYLKFREELKGLEVSAWMGSLDKLAEQSASIQASQKAAKEELERLRASVTENYHRSETITEQMRARDLQMEAAREQLTAQENEIGGNKQAAAVLQAEKKNNQDSIRRLQQDMSEDTGRIQALREQIQQIQDRVTAIATAESETRTHMQQLSNVVDGNRMKMAGRENKVTRLREETTQLTIEGRSLDSRINMLAEMEKDYEGFNKAVKTVMQASHSHMLQGIHGPVANLVHTADRYTLAIETALGAAAQNVVVDTSEDGKAAIEYLKRRDAGRGTFLPIQAIRGGLLRDVPAQEEGFLGLALDLIQFEPQYRNIMENLLGKTVVTDTLSHAVTIAQRHHHAFRLVSLDGQVIHPGGSMTGGSAGKGTGVLSRANELSQLREKRVEILQQQQQRAQDLSAAERELAAARYDLDVAGQQLSEAQRLQASYQAEREARQTSAGQLKDVLEAMTQGESQRQNLIASYEKKNRDIDEALQDRDRQEKEMVRKAEALREQIRSLTQEKMDLEAQRTQADREAQRQNESLIDQERLVGSIENQATAAEMEERQIIDKLWDTYELTRSAAQQIRQPVENATEANRRIASLRRSIRELGTPNLGAIEESQRVGERYDYLTEQRDDITKAKTELLGIIQDITSQMETIFLQEFAAIDQSFRTTFLELFGGGHASLRLEDENDCLNCGIDIRVQPPGKAVSNISLLSGGEKAFVAIALYFSILRLKPTPFCIMDEIEAALDEENVVRFANYLHRLEKTQFIVITHRRGTMEKADVLLGVTMQEKGVSQVLELDLEQAKKTAEN